MNQLKTTVLLGLLTGLFMLVGYAFGGQNGMLMALALAALMNVGTYWFSDKLVLSMYGAKEVSAADAPKLHAMVRHLVQKAGLPMPKLYIVNLPVPNAFATGRNPQHAAIAVSAGILELLSDDELEGVLAHELSHVKNRDILVSTIAATLAGALSYLAQIAYYGGGMRSDDRDSLNPVALLLLLIVSPLIATLLHLAVSRSREYLADETGANMTRNPRGLAEALRKLEGISHAHPLRGRPSHEATAHMFIVNPFRASKLAGLFSTHPPMAERIQKLEAMRM